MYRQLLLVCILFFTSVSGIRASEATSLLMPKPHQLTENGASFDLNRTVSLTDPTSSSLLASLFTTGNGSATVTVNIVDASTLGTFDYTLAGFDNEGYKLLVTDNAITITAATKTGVIRAAQTLMQLKAATNGASIPGVNITDYPAFKLRGFMHDVGRSFISFDELKKEIDLLSRFKVNVFHWHLTDNQGFRFESNAYPQFNQATNMIRFAGSYYTQAQCTELEAYAAERGVIVIPEIDMPGHSTAFTNAMGYTMSSTQGKEALKVLLRELADAFPQAPYIHMGADEAGTTAEFVNEMSQYIKETLGRKCIVWNPISGVTISKSNLPYIDMTEMWSTSGRKIDGLPNIDCRYNYINHFDVFADLVGIYKSNVYYAQQGSSEVAGAITAIWNDRKTPTETDIISQNGLYAHALATAERGWLGGGNAYIEVGGTTLPNSGSEFEEFADWECRFLHYKDTWLANEPIPYVKQTNVKWRITQPFPNGGTASTIFPPETATDDVLPDQFTYNGQTYTTSMATGAGIYLRHVWGTTVPAFFSNPTLNTTAYAWTYVYSPTAQTAGALIEFQNYSRSENDKAPDAGNWDRKGSRIWVNDEEVAPPTWTNSGVNINNEVDLGNENFPARNPISINLREGWNKILLKLPYVNASNIRLNKWMFTFVLTDASGRHALDNITYSPIQSFDANAENVVAKISEIKTYINSVCNDKVGYYPISAAATLNDKVAEVEATLQSTLTAAEREAQVAELQSAFEAFKNSLSSQVINQPIATTMGETHYYTLCTPLRGSRYATSSNAGGELAGVTTVTAASCWKFVSRTDGTWDMINALDGSFVSPNSANNTVLKTQATQPTAGWTISKADATGYVIITSGSCQFNQTNIGSSVVSGGYKVYNWGSGTTLSDTGCKYVIEEIAEDDIPFPLSTAALDELTNYDINVSSTAATSLTTGQWYVMRNVGRNGYLYEKTADHKLYTQATKPSGNASNNAQSLVRLVEDGNGKYYLQTGFGNYFYTLIDGNDGSGVGGNNNGTTSLKKAAYTIGNISSGYFYLQDINNVIMDANTVGGTVAGWGTTIPTSNNSNASWQFYPVTLTESIGTAFEVYTINNTSPSRGALIYNPSASEKWVWSSGKSGTFNNTDVNSQWVLYPTGNAGEYYLYNIGAQKFAIPTMGGSFNGYSWMFSHDAVAVKLNEQSDGTYKIFTSTGNICLSVSNNYTGPIINYNDIGAQFTMTKLSGITEAQSQEIEAAVGRLIHNSTPLAAVPTSDGWYAIQIKTGDHADRFVYAPENEVEYQTNRNYPLTFNTPLNIRPAQDDPFFYTRIEKTNNGYSWILPNGKYLRKNSSNYFPTSTSEVINNVNITYSANGMQFAHGGYKAAAYLLSNKYFIGETSGTGGYFDVYPINLSTAGLTAWQMVCADAPETQIVSCTRSDVYGLTRVYKNGYFFLPSNVTPNGTDFNLDGATEVVVDATNHTVTFTYNPNLAMVEGGVNVAQGWQTAGRDGEVMLLKVTVAPFKAATNVTMNVNLKDGSEANISALTLYEASTNSPEIYSTGSGAPTKTVIANTNISGSTATFSIENLSAGTHYYWIGATVKDDATLGAIIDAAVKGITYTCNDNVTNLDLTAVGDPADRGAMIFNAHSYPFLPRDNGSRVYRIPAMVVADDGSIIVAADKRYESYTDIGGGHVIDIVVRRSSDGGKTWSAPVTIAKGVGTADNNRCGYGDPSLVKGKNGKLYCLFAAGNLGYFYGQKHVCMSTSTDNGVTWSSSQSNPPIDLYATGAIRNATGVGAAGGYGLYDYFVTSGKGLYTSDGILMYLIPAQTLTANNYTITEGTYWGAASDDYLFYSTDDGATWYFSPTPMIVGGDEAKVIEMNDGSLFGSIRKGGPRRFNTANYTKNNDGTLSFTYGTQWDNNQLHQDSQNNQDILYYQRETETGKTDVIIHSMTTGQHANLKLYYSTDQGANWTEFLNVQTKGARYVTMERSGTEGNPGSLYLFYEDQSLNSAGGYTDYNHYPLNFLEITREQLESLIPTLNDYAVPDFLDSKDVKIVNGLTGEANNGSWNGLTWTSNAASGVAGLKMTLSDGSYNRFSNYNSRYNLAYHPDAANTNSTLTLMAPEGYVITGYSVQTGVYQGQTYTLTPENGTAITPANLGNEYTPLTVSGLNTTSTTITITTTDASKWLSLANFTVTLAKPLALNVVGDKSYATLYVPFDVQTDVDTKAYYIIEFDKDEAKLSEVAGGKIPAKTAVVLINENASAQTTLELTSALDPIVSEEENMLKGTLVPTKLDLSNETSYYYLGRVNGNVGFYKFKSADGSTTITLGANKAYMDTSVPTINPVRGFKIGFAIDDSIINDNDGFVDGINEVQATDENIIYDLNGLRVNTLRKGIYIVNGKKLVITDNNR